MNRTALVFIAVGVLMSVIAYKLPPDWTSTFILQPIFLGIVGVVFTIVGIAIGILSGK